MRIGLLFKVGKEDRYIECSWAFTDDMEIKGEIRRVLRFTSPDAPVHSAPLDCLISIKPIEEART